MRQYKEPEPSSLEDISIDESQAEAIAREDEEILRQQIGARMLRTVGYSDKIPTPLHNAELVFANSRKRLHREKVPRAFDNNNKDERKLMLHINTLERAISAGGSAAEKSILDEIIHGNSDMQGIHITDMEDIPDSYWRSQEEAYRDNGAIVHYDDSLKARELVVIRRQQIQSLARWENYLQHESCPYPIWFKLYALDGISKMGKYSKEHEKFAKRDNTTVAPYPRLDEAALAKVFQSIVGFYNLQDKAIHPSEQGGEADEELIALVKAGNFNNLYTEFLTRERNIIEVPKDPDNIHGQWIEYIPGDEEKLAKAADCTPWCIVSPDVARNYLEFGCYGVNNGDDTDDDYDDNDYNNYDNGSDNNDYDNQSKAKFLLFHLDDPVTGEPSGSGCASIRLGVDGRVAEISGLQNGQALDDSLVDIVEEEVMSLPGGEEFLEKFKDKKRLIEIDHKWRRGEELSAEDIAFINGPIHTLDTYNDEDPRVTYAQKIAIPLQNGEDIEEIVNQLCSDEIVENLNFLLDHGASADDLTSQLDNGTIFQHLDTFLNHGADIDTLLDRLRNDYLIVQSLDTLLNYGADINKVVKQLGGSTIIQYLDPLLEHGANIDNLVNRLDSEQVSKNFDTLLEHKAKIDDIVAKHVINDELFNRLSNLEFNGQALWERVFEEDKKLYDKYRNNSSRPFYYYYTEPTPLRFLSSTQNVELLLRNGANSGDIAQALYSRDSSNFDEKRESIGALLGHGLDGNVAHAYIMAMPNWRYKYTPAKIKALNDNFLALLDNGLNLKPINKDEFDVIRDDNVIAMVSKFGYDGIVEHFSNEIYARYANDDNLLKYVYNKMRQKVNRAAIHVKESARKAFENLPEDFFGSFLHDYDSMNKIDALLKNGIDINEIVEKLDVDTIERHAKYLLDNGSSLDALANRIVKKGYDPHTVLGEVA